MKYAFLGLLCLTLTACDPTTGLADANASHLSPPVDPDHGGPGGILTPPDNNKCEQIICVAATPAPTATPRPLQGVLSYTTDRSMFQDYIASTNGYYRTLSMAHMNGNLYAAWVDIPRHLNFARRVNGVWTLLSPPNGYNLTSEIGVDMRVENNKLYVYWRELNGGAISEIMSTEITEQ